MAFPDKPFLFGMGPIFRGDGCLLVSGREFFPGQVERIFVFWKNSICWNEDVGEDDVFPIEMYHPFFGHMTSSFSGGVRWVFVETWTLDEWMKYLLGYLGGCDYYNFQVHLGSSFYSTRIMCVFQATVSHNWDCSPLPVPNEGLLEFP